MNKELNAKILVTAIALSFLAMTFSGLSGLATNNQDELNLMNNLSKGSEIVQNVNTIRDDAVFDFDGGINTIMNAPPGKDIAGIPFADGFETYTVGQAPDDPPWTTIAENDTDEMWEEWFETSTLNENPDPTVWNTIDGGASTVYWSRDMEDAGIGQNLADAYWVGLTGSYYPGPTAGGTLLGATPPAGAPAGSVWPGITSDTMAAEYTGGGAAEYWGPADISDPDEDHVIATAWVYPTTTNQLNLIYYDGTAGAAGAEIVFFGGDIIHLPGTGQATITTYATNTWIEIGIEYDDATETYSVWIDGVEYAAGSTYETAGANINDLIFYSGAGTADCFIDNVYAGIPSTGTSEDIYVTNTWSASAYDGGTQSLYMDQNGETNQASTEATLPAIFYGDDIWMWFVVYTDTVANTNGATFYGVDWMGENILGIRFDSGNIQYYSDGTWNTMTTFADNTEYMIEIGYNDITMELQEIYVNGAPMSVGGNLIGGEGAGLSSFRMEGTPGTQSTIWLDYIGVWTVMADATIEVVNSEAMSGAQSLHFMERGADTYSEVSTAIVEGVGVGYGEFTFWFLTGMPQGGVDVYLYSSGGTMATAISLGTDLGGGAHPGSVEWVDGMSLIPGPAFTPYTWNNISLLYDMSAGTFEAFWNGINQGTFDFTNPVGDIAIVAIYGGAPLTPGDFYFDDVTLWIDDPPANPTNLRVAMPPPIPSIENNYTVDQDNAVEGTVTGTFANVDEILPLDGTTQDIQETSAGGGVGTTEYTYNGITGPSGTHVARRLEVDAMPPTGGNVNANAEATTAQYALITNSDNNRWIGADPNNGDENFFWSEFQIAEAIGDITEIVVSFEGQGGGATNMDIWVLDSGTWTDTGSTVATGAGTDATVIHSFTSNFANIITGGKLTWGCYQTDSSDEFRADRINATVKWSIPPSYSLEHRWRTENVPAGADNMELRVTAATSAGSDDTFTFGYATAVGGPYTPLITVNSATQATYTAAMPVMSGQFYINVIDDNDADAVQADSIIVDAVTIYWQEILGGSTVNEVATADNAVSGTVTGTYALTTSIPEDATAQEIAEVAGSGPATLIDEGFEGGAVPPAGWTTNDFDGDGYDWGLADSTAGRQVHSGTYGAYSASYDNTVGALNPDNYLISPLINLGGYSVATLTWWDATQDPAWPSEYYEVRVSTTGTAPGDFSNVVYSGTLVDDVWRQRTVDLSAYTGGSIYLTWFHTASTDWYEMDIDDILLTADSTGNFAEHRWTMENLPMNALSHTLNVYGWTSGGADDNFDIGWSQNLAGPYTSVITINSATPQLYSTSIPAVTSGPLYINVKDDNPGDAGIDSVFIDMLTVESSVSASNTTLNIQWDLSTDDGAGANDVAFYNIYCSDAELGGNIGGTYNYLDSVPAGTNVYAHIGEETDLVNNIWYVVFAEDVHGSESYDFAGYASKFNVAPEAQNVLVNGMTEVLVSPGTSVNLAADIYDDTSTWEDIPKIDGAEWYDDFSGDPGEGLGNAMTFDGVWDSLTEPFTATINTAAWGYGESHFIYVRGHEAGPGNTGTGWGTPVGVWVNTTAAPSFYEVPISPAAGAGDWIFISFPVMASGNIEDVLNDATNGDGQTTWDIAKWYNPQDATDPWKSYSTLVAATLNDMPTLDNTMGVWLRLVTNGGDNVITLGTAGTYSAIPVDITLYAGWNLVAYPSATSLAADVSLMGTGADMIGVYQAAAPYVSDTAALNTVTLTEGNAYWIHVPAMTTWTVNP